MNPCESFDLVAFLPVTSCPFAGKAFKIALIGRGASLFSIRPSFGHATESHFYVVLRGVAGSGICASERCASAKGLVAGEGTGTGVEAASAVPSCALGVVATLPWLF